MSKCEACGGDGLIEVGAYRGVEDDPNTRECRLCGGVVTTTVRGFHYYHLGSVDDAISKLSALGHAASQAGITLKESTSGVRRTASVVVIDDPPHTHQWKPPEKFGPYVRFGCHGCSKGLVFSKHGNLADGEAPDSSTVNKLSRKAIVFAARNELNML